MPNIQQFRLPDVGEGLTEAEIVSWKVKVGDRVAVNDVVVEIETAKSLVELPVPYAGVVHELLVPEGHTVDVGTPIIAVDAEPAGGAGAGPASARAATAAGAGVGAGAAGGAGAGAAGGAGGGAAGAAGVGAGAEPPGAAPGATDVAEAPAEGSVEPGLIGGPAPGGRTSVLVGYGPRTTAAVRRPRKANVDSLAEGPVKPQRHGGFEVGRMVEQQLAEEAAAPHPQPHRRPHTEPASVLVPEHTTSGPVRCKPPVRKLAKDLGVDLRVVAPTGPDRTVTREDVLAAAPQVAAVSAAASAPVTSGLAGSVVSTGGPALGVLERETRVPVKGVRRATAQAMVASAFTAPHVTEFVTVDVTRTMKLVQRLRADPEFAGVKVSPLLLVAKALLLAIRRNPEINAAWDEQAQEIVVKHYVNLGIAAATPRGLVVPNIKDAQNRTLRQLADDLAALTTTAREGRTQPADMAGGTISITNVGVFGVDTGTPILNPGEAAILAFGAVRPTPWVHRGKVLPRQVTTLALSFDHRLVDGDLGSRFLADVAAVLERPERALVWA
jgi:2-oxoisovalerate dehydrogenase E2 component (dihydrolipoyl transacylase)